jgi:hypothetical protein
MQIVLSPSQITIVGFAAMLVAWLVSLIVEKFFPWFLKVTKWKLDAKIDLGRFVKTILVGLAAFGLAWWWYPAQLPPLPVWVAPFGNQVVQFFGWLPLLLAALSPYVGVAMPIYNMIFGYVLDPDKRKQILLAILKLIFKDGIPIQLLFPNGLPIVHAVPPPEPPSTPAQG